MVGFQPVSDSIVLSANNQATGFHTFQLLADMMQRLLDSLEITWQS